MKKTIPASAAVTCLLLLSAIVFAISRYASGSDEHLKILFIGNSYTFNNDLSTHVERMIMETGKGLELEIKTLAPGGAKLHDHLNSSFTSETIANGNWDIVVIQGHSLEPLTNPESFAEAAAGLAGIAKESGAEAYLFETWARAEGNPIYSENWSGKNPDSMQKLLSEIYADTAQSSGAKVIPIGSVWMQLIREKESIGLYSGDGAHPTLAGTYLIACMVYPYITRKDPRELQYVPPEVKKSEAETIRQYAAIPD